MIRGVVVVVYKVRHHEASDGIAGAGSGGTVGGPGGRGWQHQVGAGWRQSESAEVVALGVRAPRRALRTASAESPRDGVERCIRDSNLNFCRVRVSVKDD